VAAAGTGEQTLTADLDNPDGDALYRRQAARAEAEEKQRRAAEREARRPVCKEGGQKFTDQRWEETTTRDPWKTAYMALAVALGGNRLVQVQSAAADQAGAVGRGQRCQSGDRTTARLLGVAVAMGTRRRVDVQQGARHGVGRRGQLQGALLADVGEGPGADLCSVGELRAAGTDHARSPGE
jgi:hypothetical protein